MTLSCIGMFHSFPRVNTCALAQNNTQDNGRLQVHVCACVCVCGKTLKNHKKNQRIACGNGCVCRVVLWSEKTQKTQETFGNLSKHGLLFLARYDPPSPKNTHFPNSLFFYMSLGLAHVFGRGGLIPNGTRTPFFGTIWSSMGQSHFAQRIVFLHFL